MSNSMKMVGGIVNLDQVFYKYEGNLKKCRRKE